MIGLSFVLESRLDKKRYTFDETKTLPNIDAGGLYTAFSDGLCPLF